MPQKALVEDDGSSIRRQLYSDRSAIPAFSRLAIPRLKDGQTAPFSKLGRILSGPEDPLIDVELTYLEALLR